MSGGLCDYRAAASCSYNNCNNIWKHFVEACHRVRSLNTVAAEYRVYCCANKDKPCMGGGYSGLALYHLRRM